jgi:hypothetical protein
MGEPATVLPFRGIYNEVKSLTHVEQTAEVGKHLFDNLALLQSKYSRLI